ncbi:hypothetical protein M0R45_020248 [Rubus argutus]|uniref:Protein kinase domain-containing protein n=1 Tax=Rubus argutus TaxID=59490 RepID=A0AAW1X8C6_RUBAR
MKPLLTHPLYLSLFLYLLVTVLVASYSPIEDITLACGSFSGKATSNYMGRNWTGDINSKFSPIQAGSSQVRTSSTASQKSVPFTAARLSHSEFTYRFPLSPGQKFIRLYFNPASYPDFNGSKSYFSVKANGVTLLRDFNPYSTELNPMESFIREFCFNIDSKQQSLNITFLPAGDIPDAYAFINAIEIVSMPTNLYYTAAESPGIVHLSHRNNYYIENSTVLEKIYRINVGGSPVSPEGDTGMYRNWYATDDLYLDDVSRRSRIILVSDVELSLAKIPNYTAPKEVYLTGRSLGSNNKTLQLSYNLTWAFPVDPDFSYLVRLHFCENDIRTPADRWFFIYIANKTAEKKGDIIQWSGGNGIPIYRDYVVFMSDLGGQRKVNLFISLQANPRNWQAKNTNAILNGLEIFKLFDSNGNNVDLNPNRPPEVTSPAQMPRGSNKLSTSMIAILAGVLSSILVCFFLGTLVIKRRWKAKDSGSRNRTTKSTMTLGLPLPSYLCRYFSLSEIKAATKNFNDTFIIGAGGFGNVYKGCIDGEATLVAIKRLNPQSSQGAHEFKTEIEMLSQLRHRHLVSLIGYCADEGEMILVYDFMARGTLRDHLYHTDNPPLPWEQRLQICIGAARGFQYLHSGAKGTIIHRDVKSTNILLDDKWVAKVSDFGLSKGTNNMSKTHISTVVKGSIGYLDPEYYRRQRLTEKSDVYSLGVVLFEVLCARPAVIQTEELKQVNLAEWTKSCYHNGELDQIIDPSLSGNIAAECLNKFTEVAISCLHDNGTERPSMTDVVRGLELALQLQQSAEGNINCTERNIEIETSTSEQRCVTKDSIKCISATIFSEINDPSGR